MREQNIKLTVVLLARRRILDDPSLDMQVSVVRRQSGLGPRAALFVLSPVSPVELDEFVHTLSPSLAN